MKKSAIPESIVKAFILQRCSDTADFEKKDGISFVRQDGLLNFQRNIEARSANGNTDDVGAMPLKRYLTTSKVLCNIY